MRDPVTIDPQLMSAVERYISSHDNDVSSLVAMFLHTFMTNSPYLEPYEVDNFILRNGRILAVWYVKCYSLLVLFKTSKIVLGNSTASKVMKYRISELIFCYERWSLIPNLFRTCYDSHFFPHVIGSDGMFQTHFPESRQLANRNIQP